MTAETAPTSEFMRM